MLLPDDTDATDATAYADADAGYVTVVAVAVYVDVVYADIVYYADVVVAAAYVTPYAATADD